MRSNGPLANKEVAMGGHGWPGPPEWPKVAIHLVRRMSHRVDPAAIAEEARTVRLDAVLGPPRRSVPVGDSSTPESWARVVPIISASVSWLIFAISGSGLDSLPKFAISRSSRASRFSLELNS